jgi:hypothetical protein
VAGFGISDVETLGSVTRHFVFRESTEMVKMEEVNQ